MGLSKGEESWELAKGQCLQCRFGEVNVDCTMDRKKTIVLELDCQMNTIISYQIVSFGLRLVSFLSHVIR
jgi:hypothetical protein